MYQLKEVVKMKKLVLKYRISKFKCFANGLLFAGITLIALILCVSDLTNNTSSKHAMFPFMIAIISLLMGFVTMFYHRKQPRTR
ncbi:hypothetical protein [Mobilitalea sibirica]|nr:hypothetical protein [Mobilitalea sibirica]